MWLNVCFLSAYGISTLWEVSFLCTLFLGEGQPKAQALGICVLVYLPWVLKTRCISTAQTGSSE